MAGPDIEIPDPGQAVQGVAGFAQNTVSSGVDLLLQPIHWVKGRIDSAMAGIRGLLPK